LEVGLGGDQDAGFLLEIFDLDGVLVADVLADLER
jgi:hypothetical protein